MKIVLIAILFIFSVSSFAKEDTDHKDHKSGEEKHEEHGDHDEHEEENPQVGEGKGITAASPEDGIKLSPQATKNFEIVTVKIQNLNSISLSKKAIVTAGEEVNIFRLRDGFYKRIDFITLKKESGQVVIKSKDLKQSDEIVVQGTGFLRIAEIAAFGGAPEGHSH
jgi:hypothetical protein